MFRSGFIECIRIKEQTEFLPVLLGNLPPHLEGSGLAWASSGPSFAQFRKDHAESSTAKTCIWKILCVLTSTQKAQISVQNQRTSQNSVFTTMLETVWYCSKVERKAYLETSKAASERNVTPWLATGAWAALVMAAGGRRRLWVPFRYYYIMYYYK